MMMSFAEHQHALREATEAWILAEGGEVAAQIRAKRTLRDRLSAEIEDLAKTLPAGMAAAMGIAAPRNLTIMPYVYLYMSQNPGSSRDEAIAAIQANLRKAGLLDEPEGDPR